MGRTVKLLGAALILLASPVAFGQAETYSIALRGVALDRAIERFVDETGVAVAYDPDLVQLRTVVCVAADLEAEDILRCILRETDLDFVRLSSGTYVIVNRSELPPLYGSVSGKVIDQDTGAPVPYAHVFIAGRNLGTVTNDLGHFSLPALLPGRYELSVSHVAYSRWSDSLVVSAGKRTDFSPSLAAEPVFATPIIVDGNAQRFPAASLAHPEVDPSARDPRQAAEPARGALAHVRGLAGVRLHDATADLHLQGGDSGEHRYELDGAPVFLPHATIGFVGPFSPFALDRLTVHKAGFGVEHGSQISGVVSMHQAVEGGDAADVMLDPQSVNALLRRKVARGGNSITAMGAARLGLPGWSGADPMADLLARWGAPDPFLVFAPVNVVAPAFGSEENRDSFFEGLPREGLPESPRLGFSDLHGGLRLSTGSLKTLTISGYRGAYTLEGGLLGRRAFDLDLSANEPPPVTLLDDYAWTNTIAQARFDAVAGSRLLWSSQLRASRFGFDHRYEIADSLVLFADQTFPLDSLDSRSISDVNDVSEWAVESSLNLVTARHQGEIGVSVARTESRFDLLMAALPETFRFTPAQDRLTALSVLRGRLRTKTSQDRLAFYARDRMQLTPALALEAGLRATYLPVRRSVYGEPRMAVHVDWQRASGLPVTSISAAGLYRQFVNQLDVSSLNAGALLPASRVWLPVDDAVRPPLAVHLSHSTVWRPGEAWEIGMEAYAKHVRDGRAIDYAVAARAISPEWLGRQDVFLTTVDTRSAGLSLAVERETPISRVRLGYERNEVRRTSPVLFDGRDEGAPWEEPHRVDVALDWRPVPVLTLSARWFGVWGRTWGFRRAYYDYFGHRPETRFPSGIDLGRPSEHGMPGLTQLDVGIAYARTVGRVGIQMRLDVLNALGRTNVLDRRLLPVQDSASSGPDRWTWEPRERTHYGRLPTAALRLSF